MTDHVNTAKGMLTMAATARNSDGWVGDRNADSQALGVCALAHAAVAIVERLDPLLERMERSFVVVTKADRP